jgi:hypothetical protein
MSMAFEVSVGASLSDTSIARAIRQSGNPAIRQFAKIAGVAAPWSRPG